MRCGAVRSGRGAGRGARGCRRPRSRLGSPAARGRGERASLSPGELLPRSRGRMWLDFRAVPIFLVRKGVLLLFPQIHPWPHDLKTKQNESRPVSAFDSRRLMAKGLCVDFFFFPKPQQIPISTRSLLLVVEPVPVFVLSGIMVCGNVCKTARSGLGQYCLQTKGEGYILRAASTDPEK